MKFLINNDLNVQAKAWQVGSLFLALYERTGLKKNSIASDLKYLGRSIFTFFAFKISHSLWKILSVVVQAWHCGHFSVVIQEFYIFKNLDSLFPKGMVVRAASNCSAQLLAARMLMMCTGAVDAVEHVVEKCDHLGRVAQRLVHRRPVSIVC